MKQTVTVYGVGGHDPSKPNNNIVESYEVNVPDFEPTSEEKIAALQAIVDQLLVEALEVNDA